MIWNHVPLVVIGFRMLGEMRRKFFPCMPQNCVFNKDPHILRRSRGKRDKCHWKLLSSSNLPPGFPLALLESKSYRRRSNIAFEEQP
jgi:hypothetical protein